MEPLENMLVKDQDLVLNKIIINKYKKLMELENGIRQECIEATQEDWGDPFSDSSFQGLQAFPRGSSKRFISELCEW
jgi:hypothetical protein